jgi:signal transduction histidine kinase/CheY-like chemotaxis protein/HPt (histidine-containing phosphotransfer) domain-containing protein
VNKKKPNQLEYYLANDSESERVFKSEIEAVAIDKAERPLKFLLPFFSFILFTLSICIMMGYFYLQSVKLFNDKDRQSLHHTEQSINIYYSQFFSMIKRDIYLLSLNEKITLIDSFEKNKKDKDLLKKVLINRLENSTFYKRISIFNADGSPAFSLVKKSRGLNEIILEDIEFSYHETADIKNVLNYSPGEVFFSDVDFKLDRLDSVVDEKELYINSYVAIHDKVTLNTKYILSISVDFNRFVTSSILNNIENIKFILMNEWGEYLFHPERKYYVGGDEKKRNNIIYDHPEFESLINNNDQYRYFKRFSFEELVYPGYYSVINLSEYGFEKPLRLLLLYDDPQLAKELDFVKSNFISMGIVFAILSFVALLCIVNYLLKPLTKFSETIANYGSNQKFDNLPVESKDEIGVLARSFHVLLKDIERQKIELNRTRHYLDGITNKAPVHLSYVDKYQTYRFVNHCYEITSGMPQSSFIGLCIKDVVGPVIYQKIQPYINRALSGEVVNFELEIEDRFNKNIYNSYTFTPEIDVDENVIGFYVCVEDITQIKRATHEVQELSYRMEFALEAPGIGVWDYDLCSDKLLWDERMYHIYQLSDKDFKGTFESWMDCLHPDDVENIHSLMDQSIVTGEDFVNEFRIIWPNGQIRWVAVHGRFIKDENDNFVRMIGTNVDFTLRKKLMLEREEALIKAEESAQLKSEFLASMSHEIRTPMNGVLGMLGLLQRTDLNKQQNHYAKLAHGSAEALLDIINDILDFSKVEAGKIELEKIDFNLSDLLGDIAESFGQVAQEKGIELILDMTEVDTKSVIGDPGRIRQIITNLLSNAVKFTDKGEILIQVELIDRDSLYPELICRVRDTGIGIPENKLDALFDSFSQVDASTTRKYGGTGLGLAIVKQLCELMGGTISVNSKLGEGSEFLVNLKLHYCQNSTRLLPPVDISPATIVIIDNNETHRQVLAKQLQSWGIETVEIANGHSTIKELDQLNTTTLKAIFINSHMSGLSGEALGREIREHKRFEPIHLVMMTTLSHQVTNTQLRQAGFTSSFPKPATMNDLFSTFTLLSNADKPSQSLCAINTDSKDKNLSVTTNDNDRDENEKVILVESTNPVSASLDVDTTCFSNAKLLLVDDNTVNQEVALGILSGLGITNVEVAFNGVEALKKLNQAHANYSIVLMDCQMPEMDGYEATHQIRMGKVSNSEIPIIAMTANAMKGDKEKCLSAGMNAYVSKPIDPDVLESVLRRWLGEPIEATANKISSESKATLSDPVGEGNAGEGVWDKQGFMKRIMNNQKIANKLIDVFKNDTPNTLNQLEYAISEEQAEEAGLLAHKLKGSVSNLGGIELAEIVKRIEEAGKSQDLSQVKSLWPSVRPNYQKLLSEIDNRMQ